MRPNKHLVGDIFVTEDGYSVTLVHRDSSTVTFRNDKGVERTLSKRVLWKGFYWTGKQPRTYKRGSQIKLNCGVVVAVISHEDRKTISVQDSLGNTMLVSGDVLRRRSMRWPFPHPDNSLYTYKEGEVLIGTADTRLTVVKALPDFEYLIEDSRGNQDTKHSTDIAEGGTVTWKHYKTPYPSGHYVYIAQHDGKPYYIGSGKKDRYKHCLSGTSHSFLLNQHFFCSADKLEVVIYQEGMTEEDALALEYRLILEHNPPYNVRISEGTFRPSAVSVA